MRDIETTDDLGLLVRRFYGAVRADALLGPVFDARVTDWEEHLDTMRRFWTTVVLGIPLYHGNPLAAHRGLLVGDEHFARWVALWRQVVTECFIGPVATDVIARAERIAVVLSRRLAEVA